MRLLFVLFASVFFITPTLSSAYAKASCGCYQLRPLCKRLGGSPRGFASHGLFCVIKKQPAHSVHTLSYRMQDFPKDCAMFNKKLKSKLGQLIKKKGLTCRAPKAKPMCGCYHLRPLCRKLGGSPRGFASHGLFCVIKKQPAHSVHTLSYRMQDFPKDCGMFNKKLKSKLGRLIQSKGLVCGGRAVKTAPLYRYYHPGVKDHLYTTNAKEIGTTKPGARGRHGFIFEAIMGRVYTTRVPGTTPLYRYYSPRVKDHFYTTNAKEIGTTTPGKRGRHGYVSEGITGYIFTKAGKGRVPLYRYYHPGVKDHLYTNHVKEIGTIRRGARGKHGFVFEAITGYLKR